MKLTKFHFWEFFHTNGGVLKSTSSKPRLNPEQRKKRVSWALTWKLRLKRSMQLVVCYLDKKWFWTTSCCKVIKILPRAPFEKAEEVFVSQPKLCSRHHDIKVMFLAIVGPPIEKCGFDGKVIFKKTR